MKIAFTGPRTFKKPIPTEYWNEFKKQNNIPDDARYVVGGAQGFDWMIAHTLVKANEEVWLKLPNPGYMNYYWEGQPKEIQWMKDNLLFAGYSSQTLYTWRNGTRMHSNFIRNMDMIDKADLLIAGVEEFRGITGGTGHAIRYAQQQRKPILALFSNPNAQ